MIDLIELENLDLSQGERVPAFKVLKTDTERQAFLSRSVEIARENGLNELKATIEALDTIRKSKGLTKTDIAKALNVTRTTISRMFNNFKVNIEIFYAVVRLLGARLAPITV